MESLRTRVHITNVSFGFRIEEARKPLVCISSSPKSKVYKRSRLEVFDILLHVLVMNKCMLNMLKNHERIFFFSFVVFMEF